MGFAHRGPGVQRAVDDLWGRVCPLLLLSSAGPARCRTFHPRVSSATLSSSCWKQEVVGCAGCRRARSAGAGCTSCPGVLLLCPPSSSTSWNSSSCPSSTPPPPSPPSCILSSLPASVHRVQTSSLSSVSPSASPPLPPLLLRKVHSSSSHSTFPSPSTSSALGCSGASSPWCLTGDLISKTTLLEEQTLKPNDENDVT